MDLGRRQRWTAPQLYGFYSKDSLQYLIRQRSQRQDLDKIIPNPEIAGRLYQIEAITEVLERFQNRRRKALIVQATGTGKTRVAISLCRSLDPGRLGQARPVPLRPPRTPQAGQQRLQGVPARRAPRLRHGARRTRTATTASTWPPIRR